MWNSFFIRQNSKSVFSVDENTGYVLIFSDSKGYLTLLAALNGFNLTRPLPVILRTYLSFLCVTILEY